MTGYRCDSIEHISDHSNKYIHIHRITCCQDTEHAHKVKCCQVVHAESVTCTCVYNYCVNKVGTAHSNFSQTSDHAKQVVLCQIPVVVHCFTALHAPRVSLWWPVCLHWTWDTLCCPHTCMYTRSPLSFSWHSMDMWYMCGLYWTLRPGQRANNWAVLLTYVHAHFTSHFSLQEPHRHPFTTNIIWLNAMANDHPSFHSADMDDDPCLMEVECQIEESNSDPSTGTNNILYIYINVYRIMLSLCSM